MIKELFWKTYKVIFTNAEHTKHKIEFARGFTWDVVCRQFIRADEISQEQKEAIILAKQFALRKKYSIRKIIYLI